MSFIRLLWNGNTKPPEIPKMEVPESPMRDPFDYTDRVSSRHPPKCGRSKRDGSVILGRSASHARQLCCICHHVKFIHYKRSYLGLYPSENECEYTNRNFKTLENYIHGHFGDICDVVQAPVHQSEHAVEICQESADIYGKLHTTFVHI